MLVQAVADCQNVAIFIIESHEIFAGETLIEPHFFFLNRAAVGWAVSCSAFGFSFFFVFSVTISKPPRMMSSSANCRPFLSSFRHIPPQEHFVNLPNSHRTWPSVRNVFLIKIGPKSLGHTRRDICKDKESNLGPVAGY